MTEKAFGKHKPGSKLPLREFERYLEIHDREGTGAWRSEYRSVQNLLDHLARCSKSESSRRKYLNLLKRFCNEVNRDPAELVALSESEASRVVQGYADELFKEDRGKNYINSVMHKLKSFFRENDMDLDVETYFTPSRYRKTREYIPKKDEVYEMADAAGNIRDRALILSLWGSGLRVSTLVALNYGDIADELEEGKEIVKVDVYPEMKERVPNACKGEINYYAFLFPEAVQALRSYLTKREEDWGHVYRDEALFQSKWTLYERHERQGKRITAKTVREIVKESAKMAGIDEWEHVSPHCLRKAFQSVLRSNTTGGGRLDKDTQEFFMGHVLGGSRDTYYDTDDVTFHREEYSKLDFSREGSSPQRTDKVIDIDDLDSYFNEGWIFVEELSSDKVVVRNEG